MMWYAPWGGLWIMILCAVIDHLKNGKARRAEWERKVRAQRAQREAASKPQVARTYFSNWTDSL